jgi:hypothetical protein
MRPLVALQEAGENQKRALALCAKWAELYDCQAGELAAARAGEGAIWS